MNTTQSTTSSAYVPGVCNINPAEIAYRRKAGWLGVGITAVLLIPLLLLDVSPLLRIILFLPILLGAIGFLQAKHHFCVGYAGSGMQNAAGKSMDTAKKVSAVDAAKDKLKANKIYLQAIIISLVATVFLVLVPHV